jgi:hypothetical protein
VLARRPFQLLVATYILYRVATRIPSAVVFFVAKCRLGGVVFNDHGA